MKPKPCDICRVMDDRLYPCGGGASPRKMLCDTCAKIWEKCVLTEQGDAPELSYAKCHELMEDRIRLGDARREKDRQERNARAKENRKAREQAYRECGLVKVRGALGGTYWE